MATTQAPLAHDESSAPERREAPLAQGESPAPVRRVNVNFSPQQYEVLQQLAQKQNISISDVLRQAIGLAKLIVDANADPNERVLIQRGNDVSELKIIR